MINKIKETYDRINCPAIVILRTDRAGQEVDNGYGVEFDLAEFAIIHENDLESTDDKRTSVTYSYIRILERELSLENDRVIEIMNFSVNSIASVDEMIKELHDTDNYEVIYRKDS